VDTILLKEGKSMKITKIKIVHFIVSMILIFIESFKLKNSAFFRQAVQVLMKKSAYMSCLK
jgi:hypothetical protein